MVTLFAISVFIIASCLFVVKVFNGKHEDGDKYSITFKNISDNEPVSPSDNMTHDELEFYVNRNHRVNILSRGI